MNQSNNKKLKEGGGEMKINGMKREAAKIFNDNGMFATPGRVNKTLDFTCAHLRTFNPGRQEFINAAETFITFEWLYPYALRGTKKA